MENSRVFKRPSLNDEISYFDESPIALNPFDFEYEFFEESPVPAGRSRKSQIMLTPKDFSTSANSCMPFTEISVWEPIEIENIAGEDLLGKGFDPIEDYFTLVVSSVKMNSPYKDYEYTISSKELYSLA